MLIELYYKDPDAGSEAFNGTIKEKYPELKPYSPEFLNKRKEYIENIVRSFGRLARGDEDLYILIDIDVKGIINVNGSKYKLVN